MWKAIEFHELAPQGLSVTGKGNRTAQHTTNNPQPHGIGHNIGEKHQGKP